MHLHYCFRDLVQARNRCGRLAELSGSTGSCLSSAFHLVDNVYTMMQNWSVIAWDESKNEKLEVERGVRFEDIVAEIMSDHVLDILEHPVRKKPKNTHR